MRHEGHLSRHNKEFQCNARKYQIVSAHSFLIYLFEDKYYQYRYYLNRYHVINEIQLVVLNSF